MENVIENLKKAIPFKDTTEVGDVVLMVKEPDEADQPLGVAYAMITDFVRDPSKREEWWFVHVVFLLVPPVPQVLTLQNAHFTGQEIFTMGGKKVFIKAVDYKKFSSPPQEDPSPPKKPGLKVVK